MYVGRNHKPTSTSRIVWPLRNAEQENSQKHVLGSSTSRVSRVNSEVGDQLMMDQGFAATSQDPAYRSANQTDQINQTAHLLTQLMIQNPDSLFTVMVLILQSAFQKYMTEQLEATMSQALSYAEPHSIKLTDWEILFKKYKSE